MSFEDLLINAYKIGVDARKEIDKIFPNMTSNQEEKLEDVMNDFVANVNQITRQLIIDEFAKLTEKLK